MGVVGRCGTVGGGWGCRGFCGCGGVGLRGRTGRWAGRQGEIKTLFKKMVLFLIFPAAVDSCRF